MCGGTELELFLQNEEGGGIMSTLRISRPVSQGSASGWGGGRQHPSSPLVASRWTDNF